MSVHQPTWFYALGWLLFGFFLFTIIDSGVRTFTLRAMLRSQERAARDHLASTRLAGKLGRLVIVENAVGLVIVLPICLSGLIHRWHAGYSSSALLLLAAWRTFLIVDAAVKLDGAHGRPRGARRMEAYALDPETERIVRRPPQSQAKPMP